MMTEEKGLSKQEQFKEKQNELVSLLQNSAKQLEHAMPSHMRPERLIRIALTTLRMNPQLWSCTKESFIGALFQSAQLGLEPNVDGQAYIVPFNNKKKTSSGWITLKEAQFQIGYKGYISLFYRHESALSIHMDEVCRNDEFRYSYGMQGELHHRPAIEKRGEPYAYYTYAQMKNGAYAFKVMSREDCIAHGKKYSKTYDAKSKQFMPNTPWDSSLDAMCKKTVLRQLMKELPKSVEIQRAVTMDETIKSVTAADMLMVPDETNWHDGESGGNGKTVENLTEPKTIGESANEDAKSATTSELMAIRKAVSQAVPFVGPDIVGDILKRHNVRAINEIPDVETGQKIMADIDVAANKDQK